MGQHAFSVILPVHNGMPYLPASVESILFQTFPNFELLLIDDGSTDGTAEYGRSLCDPRVRYIRLQKLGLVNALNHGLREARSPLVARMDADDVAFPDRFERQLQYLNDNPGCVVLGGNARLINEGGMEIGAWSFPLSDSAIRWEMYFTCPFLHPAVVYRRDAVLGIGGYREEYDRAEDYDLWVRLATRGQLANCPQQLISYRVHQNSVTNTKRQLQNRLAGMIAGSYAAQQERLSAELETMRELHWFLRFGVEPATSSAESLAALYSSLRARSLALASGSSQELVFYVAERDHQARWRCVSLWRRHAVKRPFRAMKWIRAARRFDPQHGSLWSMACRKFNVRPRGRQHPCVHAGK